MKEFKGEIFCDESLTIKLPGVLKKDFKKFCSDRGATMSGFIKHLIINHLREKATIEVQRELLESLKKDIVEIKSKINRADDS